MFILRVVNVALALLVVFFAAPASAQPNNFVCTANVANPTQVRAFALTELIGDIVIVCTGGPAIPVGAPIPQINVTVTLANTTITSRILDPHTGATEALLLVNEPGSLPGLYTNVPNGYGPNAPQILCPAPLTGCPQQIAYIGPAAVPVLPGVTAPPPVQDAPNIYEGVLTAPNQVTFLGVPLAPAFIPTGGTYQGTALVLRLTNIRANTSFVGGPVFQGTASVLASVSTSPGPLLLQNPMLMAANIFTGIQAQNGSFDFVPCPAGNICPLRTLRFTEGFASAAKTRGGFEYWGTPLPPQNVPGFIYPGVESGFYAPTMVNAAPGAPIGLADFGTRLKAVLEVPPGVRLWVGTGVLPPPYGYLNATLTATEAGPLNFVPAPFGINGRGVAELPVMNGIATAVWEVLSANPAAQETFEFPLFVSYTDGIAPSTRWKFHGSFAPTPGSFPPDGGFAHGFDYPIPRFATDRSVQLPSSLTLAPGQVALLPVALVPVADPGGAAIAFTSGDPSVATVTPLAVVLGGAMAPDRRLPVVTALQFGRTWITASSPGYASASVLVNVSLTMSFSPPWLTLPLGGRQARPLLTLSAPAPAGGLVVMLSSDNPAVATVPASVFVAADALSVPVPVSHWAPGGTTIRARISPFVPEAVLPVAVTP